MDRETKQINVKRLD